jgi:hypothetical protein
MAHRFEARPRRNACHPHHGRPMASRAGRITRRSTLSRLIGSPSLERKTKLNSGLPVDLRYASRISAKVGIIGTESRLARVFGRLTTDLHIERLIAEVIDPDLTMPCACAGSTLLFGPR